MSHINTGNDEKCNGEKPFVMDGKDIPLQEVVSVRNGKNPSLLNEEQILLQEKENGVIDSSPVSFEEAVKLTGQGKFHTILQIGCGLCLASMIAEILNTAYLLPSAECDFHMTSSDKGMLSAICYLGMISSSHLWGFMADTKGRRLTLLWTLILDGLCALASSFSHSYWLFLMFRFFNGFFICGPSAVTYAYLGEFHSMATRSRAIMWGAVYISAAIIALPGVAWIFISQEWSFELPAYTYHSWRVFVIACSVPSFLTALIFFIWLPESPKFLLSQGKEKEALDVLQYMYSLNTKQSKDHYQVKSLLKESKCNGKQEYKQSIPGVLQLMWDQTKPLFMPPHLTNILLGCSVMFGIFASFNGLLLWLPELFNRLAEFAELYPGVSKTVCGVISTLAGNSTVHIPEKSVFNISNALLFDTLTNETLQLQNNFTAPTCTAVVSSAVFEKSLIIGGSSAAANIACALLVKHVGKKNLLVTCMILAGIAGLALLIANSATWVLILSSILQALTMTSPTVLNSIIVDIFPTHLRAMAVSVAMLMGRVGTVTSSIILGLLLEVNCIFVFLTLSGILIVCGCLALLLPSPWRWYIR